MTRDLIGQAHADALWHAANPEGLSVTVPGTAADRALAETVGKMILQRAYPAERLGRVLHAEQPDPYTWEVIIERLPEHRPGDAFKGISPATIR